VEAELAGVARSSKMGCTVGKTLDGCESWLYLPLYVGSGWGVEIVFRFILGFMWNVRCCINE